MTQHEKRLRRQRIAKMCRRKVPLSQICAAEQISESLVRSACVEHGVTFPSGPDGRKLTRGAKVSTFKILMMLLDGYSVSAAAERYNITMGRVSHIKTAARAAGFEV